MTKTHLNPPAQCDICKAEIKVIFYDGKTQFGLWATMCSVYFDIYGVELGTGRDQRYELRADKLEKTGG